MYHNRNRSPFPPKGVYNNYDYLPNMAYPSTPRGPTSPSFRQPMGYVVQFSTSAASLFYFHGTSRGQFYMLYNSQKSFTLSQTSALKNSKTSQSHRVFSIIQPFLSMVFFFGQVISSFCYQREGSLTSLTQGAVHSGGIGDNFLL